MKTILLGTALVVAAVLAGAAHADTGSGGLGSGLGSGLGDTPTGPGVNSPSVNSPGVNSTDAKAVDYGLMHADQICQALAADPSPAGVLNTSFRVVKDGLTTEQAGVAIGEAVLRDCTQYTPLLQRFASMPDMLGHGERV